MSRTARKGFLSDIQTLGNSYVPIGTIIPIFKADHSKVTDNGVVQQLGSVVSGAGGGSGYTTNLSDPNGFEVLPITLEINAGNFSVSTETITYTDHGFITGDKLTVIETSQAPNSTKLGGSIAEIEVSTGGAGYTSSPTISITDNGSGPVKQANVAAVVNTATGELTGVTILDGGLGYQFPQITISGGGATTQAVLNIILSTSGEGGVEFDTGFTFYVDKIDDDNFRLARSNGDITAGKYYNVTDLGSSGNFTLASTTGTGLRVGVSANLDGTLNFCSIKNPGYGYQDGEVVYVNQPGSDGLGRIEIVTTSSPTADDIDFQYPGFLYCDGSEYNADEYPLLFNIIKNDYGGSGGTYKIENFGSSSAVTFKVPDYKTRKLVGSGGGVTGGGSPVSGNVIASVGTSGGKWYFSKKEQETLYDIGNIVISGYTNVSEFVGGSLTGEVTFTIGPLQEKPISTVPEHEHQILTSTAASATSFEGTGAINDDHSVGFKDSTGQVGFFLPEGGGQLFHNHGIVDYVVTDPNLSTFGNVSGIGEKEYKSFASSAINITNDIITINNHQLFTGNMIRVSANSQSTSANLSDGVTNYGFNVNTTWFVIKQDDNTIKLAKTKYLARTNTSLDITATGSSGDITIETGYKIAGNLPPDVTTTIGTPAPTLYIIDDTYTIGGKEIQLPGNTITSTEVKVEEGSSGSYTVPAPAADELPIVGISGFAGGAGGGGATTDGGGGNGGQSYYQFTYNGNTYRITATGGEGGATGDNGGAGGDGGAGSYTVNGSTTNFSNTLSNVSLTGGLTLDVNLYYTSNDGGSGGPSSGGEGGTSSLINGAGGDGSRTLYTGSGTVSQSFTTPTAAGQYTAYNIPNDWPLDSLTAEVRGGSGGAGHDGNESATPGTGIGGKRITALVNQTNSGTLRVYVGGGGGGGNGLTRGAGSSNGFASGGNGGNGSGAGGGGGGGAASAVGTSSTMFIGAAGGGGGGGGGNTGGNAGINGTTNASNDGVQQLGDIFGNGGGTGTNSVCSGGGGGGGGGGVGVGAGIGGGGGGGNGSNARRSGYGGQRGQSSIKSSGTGPTATLIDSGGAGNAAAGQANTVVNGNNGSVVFTAVENQTYYGSGGGGGGSGAFFYWSLTGMTNVGSGTAVVGSGGNNGGQDGAIQVGYLVTSATDGGTTTSSTSGLFASASDGVDYAPSGTGTGTAGFDSPNDEQYLRFEGSEQVRYARTIQIDASEDNSKNSPIIQIIIQVITGNGSNGGETPNEPLELFASNDNASSFTKIGTISSAGNHSNWTDVTLDLDSDYQVSNLILEIRQTRASSGNAGNDNYGIHQVKFIYDETEQQIVTYPTAKADLGIEQIVERIEPQGDPLTSAGIDVNEGLFTLSSAVKLNVTSALQPEIDIPLLTRYHRVKYLIRAY